MKYSDLLADWLAEQGYTTCFFVAGGNIMHLLESCSRKFKMIPVVHEVAAGIASEYFNEMESSGERAFALITAGPGLTNIITALAGAWLDSHELLVLGGQVKVSDLARGQVRQRGIQEVDGVALAAPVAVKSVLMDDIWDQSTFAHNAASGSVGRKGPVFIEIPLDIQGRNVDDATLSNGKVVLSELQKKSMPPALSNAELSRLTETIRNAKRPVLLLSGGIDRKIAAELVVSLAHLNIPIVTSWNGVDRIGSEHPLYFGRSDTWGMRYSNLIVQQADVLVALGSRLGIQQTGFNWQQYVPGGKIIQVDCDKAELTKGHPKVDWAICADANEILRYLVKADLGTHEDWLSYCREIKKALPLDDPENQTSEGYISPHAFVLKLSELCNDTDIIIPCSSGGANTVMMQTFAQKTGQFVMNNRALASMGYGLSGAIGAAVAGNGRRTVLVEGDGGFSQNIQEIGTAAINKLNLKIFIFDDNGYASIRMTQSNYFGGRYVGCDIATGLGLPSWPKLFAAWDVPCLPLKPGFENDKAFQTLFAAKGTAAFIVPIDPKQTYFPKITSRMTASGSMESNPLHQMSPPLSDILYARLGKYLK